MRIIFFLCVFLASFAEAAVQREDGYSEGSAKSADDCKESEAAKALKNAANEEARRAVQGMMEGGKLPADKLGADKPKDDVKQVSLGLEKAMEPCR